MYSMKKAIWFMLLFGIVILLIACSTAPSKKMERTPRPVPSHVQNMYDSYKKVLTDDVSIQLTLGDSVLFGKSTYTNSQWFNIPLSGNRGQIDLYAEFNIAKGGEAEKSFSVSFGVPDETAVLKEVVVATLMATNSKLSEKEARTKMQDLVNSYKEDDYSKVIESGNYILFLTPKKYLMGYVSWLEVIHKDEIMPEIDIAAYSPMDYETALAENMNNGVKVFFTGTVEKKEKDALYDDEINVLFKGEDGHKYLVGYLFASTPVTFQKGKSYVIYGSICPENDGVIPVLTLDYMKMQD